MKSMHIMNEWRFLCSTHSTFLTSSQWTTNIHWPWYCIATCCHSFCGRFWPFLSGNEYGHVFMVSLFMSCRWRSSYLNGESGGFHHPIKPRQMLASVSNQTLATNVICRGIFLFCEFWRYVIVLFMDLLTSTA